MELSKVNNDLTLYFQSLHESNCLICVAVSTVMPEQTLDIYKILTNNSIFDAPKRQIIFQALLRIIV